MDDLSMPENDRAVAGHNSPPNPAIESAQGAFERLGKWLENNPVIQDEETARAAKLQVDGTKGALDDLEAERDSKVRPLNERVKATNETYKGARAPLERLFDVLKGRLNTFIEAERARREEEARLASERAAQAEAEAREAEAREREAIDNAEQGEFTDVATATAEADEKFGDYRAASRELARADKAAARVVVGGGFSGRALSQRTSETLEIEDAAKALRAIVKERNGELPEKLADAIRSAARDYRKAKGTLPPGIISNKTRSL